MSSPRPDHGKRTRSGAAFGRWENHVVALLSRNVALRKRGDLWQLAVPRRIYLDCWSNTVSRGYKDRSKPSLLTFSPF